MAGIKYNIKKAFLKIRFRFFPIATPFRPFFNKSVTTLFLLGELQPYAYYNKNKAVTFLFQKNERFVILIYRELFGYRSQTFYTNIQVWKNY
jgi:hypothetical protein